MILVLVAVLLATAPLSLEMLPPADAMRTSGLRGKVGKAPTHVALPLHAAAKQHMHGSRGGVALGCLPSCGHRHSGP